MTTTLPKHHTKPTIFVDMDGVLARYDARDYTTHPPKHEVEHGHYFRHRPGDRWAIRVFDELVEYALSKNSIDVSVLSTTSNHELPVATEQRTDKRIWLFEHLANEPGTLPATISDMNKVDAARRVLGLTPDSKLPSSALLLDDFNDNLEAWRDAGGTAVKYLNGVNSAESWDGLSIARHHHKSPKAAALQLVVYACT